MSGFVLLVLIAVAAYGLVAYALGLWIGYTHALRYDGGHGAQGEPATAPSQGHETPAVDDWFAA